MNLRRIAFMALSGALILSISPTSARAQWEVNDPTFQAIQIPERVENKMVGVRLWDFWKYLPKVVEDLKDVEQALMNSPERFIAVPGVKKIYNLFLRAEPTQAGATFKLPLTYFVRDGNDVLRFEKVDIIYTSSRDMRAIPQGSVRLSETDFRVDVALIDRRAVVSDEKNGLTMVFPLGVGAFDDRVLHDSVSLLTPRFKEGYLDKRTAIYAREKPRYYAGKPFIRITTERDDLEKGWTGIGFHAQPNLAQFIRAFDSHGCIRMQLDDLYTLYWIVSEGPASQVPVSISYEIDNPIEHPVPTRDMPWRKVNNIGTAANPLYNIDRDGLTEAVLEWKKEAPLHELVDLPQDNYHDFYDYDLDWREKDRRANHEAMCRERYLSNKLFRSRAQRDYEKCVKQAKRDVSLGDRLYRFWIH